MSNPRRGLLAAGLTAAVVGSMGVVWTLNASAAETVPAEIPAAVAAPAAAESEPVPPALLPWGEAPEELEIAKPGANSAAVAAAGADAAPADTSGSTVPVPEYAPKGRYAEGDVLRNSTTTVVPPAPPAVGVTKAKAAEEKAKFTYVVAEQAGDTDGTWANLTIEKPVLKTGDHHSLAEITVRSGDEFHTQIVEVGWNVDPSVNGDSDPHLFVFHWVDLVPACYNGCGFVPYSLAKAKPGDTLPVGEQKRFGIQHSDGVWWIAYDSAWIGFFPDSLWGGRYTKGGLTQWFGEIASPLVDPCSEMGNGDLAKEETAARIGSISFVNGPTVKYSSRAENPKYTIDVRSDRTFRYGGPDPLLC